jgi:antitoxin (DNA-binding transcriptional repressor) of toxin-antitoxin stability system
MQNDTISAKEIRHDLIGFLRRLKKGQPITVIYRSKPLVTVISKSDTPESQASIPGSPEAVARSLAYARQLRKGRKPVLDPSKSIKALYAETMDEKYGPVR